MPPARVLHEDIKVRNGALMRAQCSDSDRLACQAGRWGSSVVQAPTADDKLNGRWKLLYTTRSGTASPIQRTFIGVDSFTVYQDIDLRKSGEGRVNNVVQFGKNGSIGQLKVCTKLFHSLDPTLFKLPTMTSMNMLVRSSVGLKTS